MKRYVNPIFVCLFGLSAVIFACKSGDENILAKLPELPSDHYALTQGTLFPAAAGINVVADTIYISICPLDASCLVQDNVSASIRLIKGAETRSVRLFTFIEDGVSRKQYPASIDSTGVRFGDDVYKVILKGRYTSTTETGRGKAGQAILQVSKL